MSGGNWKEMFDAAVAGDLGLVQYHVEAGVDVNYAHPEFLSTPLVAAILAGQEPVSLYLLECGADPSQLSEFDGVTPVQAARQAGLAGVEAKLVELGASPLPPRSVPRMRWLDNRIPPPVVAVVVAAGMYALARWLPLARFELPFPWLIGFGVAGLGGIVSAAGARAFRLARTTVNPLHPERASSVVTSGIYRYTRNPMYVGILFVLLGCFLAFGALGGAIGLPAFVWYIGRYQIAPEERLLEAKFGAAYVSYRKRVRRWV